MRPAVRIERFEELGRGIRRQVLEDGDQVVKELPREQIHEVGQGPGFGHSRGFARVVF